MVNYISGKKTILELINNGFKFKTVYLSKDDKEIIDLCSLKKIKLIKTDKSFIDKLVNGVNHQGYAGELSEYKYFEINDIPEVLPNKIAAPILILDSISDAGNFGAILRTASAAGIEFVIIKKDNQAPVNDIVHKNSLGATLYLKIIRVINISSAIEILKGKGYWIIGTSLQANKTIYEAKINTSIALVVGNEEKGVSKLILEKCDFIYKIPMSPNRVQSLNVSVAAGVLIYEILNQIRNKW